MSIYQAAFRAIDVLESFQVDYMLAGSLASMYYSFSRATIDADFVIELKGRSISSVAAALGPEYRLDPQFTFETASVTTRHVVEVIDTPFKLEFFRLSNDPFDRSRFERRTQVELLGRMVWMPTPEDMVVMKVRWGRKKDTEDVASMLGVQGDALDFAYIHQWCNAHGSQERLDEIRASIPKID